MLESLQWQQSIDVQRDDSTTPAFEKGTITKLDADTPKLSTIDGPKGHPAFAFEEDLSKSWVYQRSLIRGPRTFSIATSKRLTQVTQSWSILSGLSLSNTSNIAVQSLPVYAEDLKTNHLYSFEEDDASLKTKWQTYLEELDGMRVSFFSVTPLNSDTTQYSQGEDKISEIREEALTNTDFLLPSFHFP